MVVRNQLPGHQGKTDGVVEIENVGETDVAVAGGVQLADVIDRKAGLELVPGAGPQAVADHFLHIVPAVVGAGRLIDQVAAQFADITDGGRPVLARIVPELTGAEFAADGEPAGTTDGRTPAHAKARGVVQRQSAIDDIVGAHVQGDHAEARRTAHPASVLEHARLGQPRGARGVNIKAGIIKENLPAAGRVVAAIVETDGHQVDETFRRDTRLARGVLIGDEPGSVSLDRHPVTHSEVRRDQLLTDNDRRRRHQIHTVHQGVAGLGGIEQRTDCADLGHRQYGHQQFRAVLDEDRHHIPLPMPWPIR